MKERINELIMLRGRLNVALNVKVMAQGVINRMANDKLIPHGGTYQIQCKIAQTTRLISKIDRRLTGNQ